MSNKFNTEPDNELLSGGAICGIVTVAATVSAFFVPSSGNYLLDLLEAVAIVIGSGLFSVVAVLIGSLIYRVALGYDGIDEPGKGRVITCAILFVLLISFIISAT